MFFISSGSIVPVVDLLLGGLDVVVDVVEVDVGHVLGEPLEHRLALEALQRVEPELRHPLRLALLPRDVADDVLVQALLGLEDVVLGVATSRACTCRDRCRKRPSTAPRCPGERAPRKGSTGISTTRHSNNPRAGIPNPGPSGGRVSRPVRVWACFTRTRRLGRPAVDTVPRSGGLLSSAACAWSSSRPPPGRAAAAASRSPAGSSWWPAAAVVVVTPAGVVVGVVVVVVPARCRCRRTAGRCDTLQVVTVCAAPSIWSRPSCTVGAAVRRRSPARTRRRTGTAGYAPLPGPGRRTGGRRRSSCRPGSAACCPG